MYDVLGNRIYYIYFYDPVMQEINHVLFKPENHASNSQLVYSNVYPKKKTNHPDLTPSAWLSRVGPAGLEPATP
jgi:hypothetical protein